MSEGRKILAGICGGIAVYKAVDLVSRLTQAGHDVHVAMTPAARKFVTPATFASISRHRVLTDIFPPDGVCEGEDLFPHLYPAAHTDLLVLLPATAGILARIAAGMADDIVSASVLGLPPAAQRVVCPAMNGTMWNQPVVQRNMRALEDAGWIRIGPTEGALACGTQGAGRMAEPADIAAEIENLLSRGRDLAGRSLLILSGPTREHLDPVRFIGNASSGRMGCALAEEAARRGAVVTFVTGPVDSSRLPRSPGIRTVQVRSAADMLEAALANRDGVDLEIFAAAVSDYAPATSDSAKTPKQADPQPLALAATPDIAARLGTDRPPDRLAVGFALETENGTERARRKLESKRFDAIVLNAAESMGSDAARFTLLTAAESEPSDWGRIDKAVCARRILDWAAARWSAGGRGP